MDSRAYNRQAWDKLVESGDRWTVPVTTKEIQRARDGDWRIVLTPTTPVPRNWFPDLPGSKVLCLASGGGQQGPILAAAGVKVTVLDASPQQLVQDRTVAEREGLSLRTIEGDMADLSMFGDAIFDLIVHPCSNCFVPDVRPVWHECSRALRPGGILLAGFTNPVRYIFDDERMENGSLQVHHSIPYSDLTDLDEDSRQRMILDKGQPLEFGHSLEDQIGGQLDAGFVITGYDEAYYVLSGTGHITLGDYMHPLRPGTVAIIPAGVPHSLEADPGQELEFVIFGSPPMAMDDDRAKPKKV